MFNTCGLGKGGNCLEFTKRPVDQIALCGRLGHGSLQAIVPPHHRAIPRRGFQNADIDLGRRIN